MIGTIKVYLNASAYDKLEECDLKTFLKYVCGLTDKSEFGKMLGEKMKNVKYNKRIGVEFMSINAKRNDFIDIGIEQGEKLAKIKNAKALLNLLDVETIAEKIGLELSEVIKLKEEQEQENQKNNKNKKNG